MTGAIAELFITLGIKGADDTSKKVSAVSTSMEGVKSTSLAAKAAVLGVMYALERMTIASADKGMGLKRFSDLTGLSLDSLQRWTYMAEMAGESADSMSGSIKSVQGAMAKMSLGMGAPGGLAEVARVTGAIDETKLKDTFYMMGKLREYARKEKNIGKRNEMLATFGIGPETIATLVSSRIELEKISKSNILSGGQIQNLTKIKEEWLKFYKALEMTRDALVSEFGMTGVKKLREGFLFLKDVVKNISRLIKDAPILGSVLAAAGIVITAAWAPWLAGILLAAAALNKIQQLREQLAPTEQEKGKWYGPQEKKEDNWLEKIVRGLVGTPNPDMFIKESNRVTKNPTDLFTKESNNVIPFPARVPRNQGNTSNNTVNQTNMIYGVPGANDALSELKKQTSDAVNTSPTAARDN